MSQPVQASAAPADVARHKELCEAAEARGVTMSQWNLVGVDKEFSEALRQANVLLEVINAGEMEDVDLSTL